MAFKNNDDIQFSKIGNVYVQASSLGWQPSQENVRHSVCEKSYFKDLQQATFPSSAISGGIVKDSFTPVESKASVYFFPMDSSVFGSRPAFVKPNDWEKMKSESCGFINPNGNVMPRMVFPTDGMTYNGFYVGNDYSELLPTDGGYYAYARWQVTNSDASSSDLPKEPKYFGRTTRGSETYSFVDCTTAVQNNEDSSVKDRVFTLSNEDFPSNPIYEPASSDSGGVDYQHTIGTSTKPYAFALIIDHGTPKSRTANCHVNVSVGNCDFVLQENDKISARISSNITNEGLTSSESCQKPIHVQHDSMSKARCYVFYPAWNGLFIASGNTDNKNIANAVYCDKENDLNYNEFLSPSFTKWTEDRNDCLEVKTEATIVDDADGGSKVTKDVRVPWGPQLKMAFNGFYAKFAYIPVFFAPKVRFSVYFKGAQSNKASSTSIGSNYVHYAYPIFCKNGSTYELKSKAVKAKELITDRSSLTCWYRFDFEIDSEDSTWPRMGFEMMGFVHKTVVESGKHNVENSNGVFQLMKARGYNNGVAITGGAVRKDLAHKSWINYATSVSVSQGIDGTSGNITLDKYAIMEQSDIPYQSVGGLRLSVHGGNTGVLVTGGKNIFNGLAMELKDNVSYGGDTIDISLYGFERKLQDIKIINAPFWDGDKASAAIKWLCDYGGVRYNISKYGDGGVRLPRSSNYMKPGVNIPQGTSVWDGLKMICDMINHKMCFDHSDGVLYFYECTQTAIPKTCVSGSSYKIADDYVLSVDLQPFMGNYYNTVFTSALRQTNTNRNIQDEIGLVNVKFTRIPDKYQYPKLPWSKVIAVAANGFMNETELRKLHKTNLCLARSFILTGQVTIPGNANLKMYSRVRIHEKDFYIYGITHTLNLVSKEYTTGIQIAEPFTSNIPDRDIF